MRYSEAMAGMKPLSSFFENKEKHNTATLYLQNNSLRDKLDTIRSEPFLFQYKRNNDII